MYVHKYLPDFLALYAQRNLFEGQLKFGGGGGDKKKAPGIAKQFLDNILNLLRWWEWKWWRLPTFKGG